MSEGEGGEPGRRTFLKKVVGGGFAAAVGGFLGWKAHENAPQIEQAVQALGERTSREAIDPQAKKAAEAYANREATLTPKVKDPAVAEYEEEVRKYARGDRTDPPVRPTTTPETTK